MIDAAAVESSVESAAAAGVGVALVGVVVVWRAHSLLLGCPVLCDCVLVSVQLTHTGF